eukprot:SM000010S04275  [mRNA]  locus=s10:599826:601305:- [translate_table: standard]
MLREQLAKFNKQQERLAKDAAERLSKDAATRKPAGAAPPVATVSIVTTTKVFASKPAVQQVSAYGAQHQQQMAKYKFLQESDKYVQMENVRRLPVGAQMKKVIDLLLLERKAFTTQEIYSTLYVDIDKNKELQENLKANVKAKHELENKEQLLKLIRQILDGTPIADIKDAYPGVLNDVQELKAAGQIWAITNTDNNEEVVYPNDPKLMGFKVEDDLKQLLRSIELPREFVDVERELIKAGIKPVSDPARRQMMAAVRKQQPKPKQKQRKMTARMKVTNAHMPELFNDVHFQNAM